MRRPDGLGFPDVVLHFNSEEVRFELPAQALALPPAYRAKVQAHWEAVNADGRFFNGQVLAAVDVQPAASPPVVRLAVTDYAHYLYAAADRNREADCRAVYCSSVLLTTDGYVLLGEMAGNTASPGHLLCPGGMLELNAARGVSAVACCERELTEEVGAAVWQDRRSFRPLCIKTGGRRSNIGLFYVVRLNSTAQLALSRFATHQAELRRAGEKPELARLVPIKLDVAAIDAFLRGEAPRADYLRPLFQDHWARVQAAADAG
ncbi:hypothetical protein [Bordetella sp. H567]|uniref:hypothetical protein n=1 Tax=Bordetella sp. H567 TaxID=1697043 RepID=UPI0011AB6709|nr:hypothetical protein [Bordetella sp. H567]